MAKRLVVVALLLAAVLNVQEADAFANGAPTAACGSLTPGHPSTSKPVPGGYFLYSNLIDNGGSYTAGKNYTLTLRGDYYFKGFMIQARESGFTTPIGSFSTPSGVKLVSCSGNPTATVTHTSNDGKTALTVQWTAPSSGTGTVKFFYAIVFQYNTFYANIDSSLHRPPTPAPPTTAKAQPSTSASSPTPSPVVPSTPPVFSSSIQSQASTPNTVPSSRIVPAVTTTVTPSSTMINTPVATPTTMPPLTCPETDKVPSSNFSLTFSQPVGCVRQSCEIFVAMAPNTMNSSYLDIYMEGIAAGWVAVGFSDSRAMENTDVIGCRVDSGSTVSVVDTWNPSPNYSPNQVDVTQDGVCTHSTSFTSGRISCLFSRYSSEIGTGEDLDLNADHDHFIMYGRRLTTNAGALNLLKHTERPVVSSSLYNPFNHSHTPTTIPVTPTQPGPSISCPVTNMIGNVSFSKYTFGTPSGCSRTSCDVYVTMAPNTMNPSYLDIYMEGTAAGWVAVGFSDSRAMENTDVIGCRVDSGSTVSVVDTWNPSPNYSPNQIDDNQDGVCTHSANFINGRIRCLFSRYGPGIGSGKDLNLSTERYIMYGRRTTSNAGELNLLQHSETPARTAEVVNPFNVTGEAPVVTDYPDKALLQVHGILMLISWPILATIGIFVASWMKPALPDGEWFQTHRALLIISLFTSAGGVIFAFAALAKNPTPGLINLTTTTQCAHFFIGILVVLFQIANPIIAIFRCKPNSPNRWVFKLTHMTIIGVLVQILALTNVGTGLWLLCEKYTLRTSLDSFWTFLGYIAFFVILEVVMHVVFTTSACKAPPKDRVNILPTILQWSLMFKKADTFPAKTERYQPPSDFELQEKKEDVNVNVQLQEQEVVPPIPPVVKEKKPPSKDAPIRWAGTVALLFLTITVVMVIVLVAMG